MDIDRLMLRFGRSVHESHLLKLQSFSEFRASNESAAEFNDSQFGQFPKNSDFSVTSFMCVLMVFIVLAKIVRSILTVLIFLPNIILIL